MTAGRRLVVVSQLPPPIHGSTVMTGIFLETVGKLGWDPTLVDRRFSRRLSQVGRFSVGKVFRAVGLELRLTRALMGPRPRYVVLFTTTSTWSVLADSVATAICRGFRAPVIHYVHTRGFTELAARGPAWNRLVGSMLAGGEMVVSLSEETADDVRQFVAPGRISIIPNTIDRVPERLPARRQGTRTVLFLSNLLPSKGALDFLDLVEALGTQFNDVSFVLAGSGARREVDEVARRAKGLRLGGRLSLAGAVNPAERTALFRRADVFVFPSRNEAQGLVLIEALAFGVPAVAYRIPGVASVVDDGSTGFLVPPGDIPGLVASVSELLSRPDLQERMATSAGRRFETTFSRDVYRENWRRVLEPSVGRPRGNGPELGVAR